MGRLSQFETLISVAELGSMARAARKLGISPAAVSKQITKLEEELGVQLLIRSTRKLSFTDIGIAYLEQVQRIMEEVEASRSLVANLKAVPYGLLKVFSTPHFASKYITPHVSEFISLYPGIELQLEIGERIPHFEGEKIDIMIGNSMQANEDLIHRRILTTRYAICASPQYFSKYGTPQTPNDLPKHHCLTHSMRRPDHLFYLDRNQTISFHPFIKVNDAKTLIDLALQGIGIVQLHHYAVKELLSEGKLKEILQEDSRTDIPIYYVLPQRRFTPGKVQAFTDFISSFL